MKWKFQSEFGCSFFHGYVFLSCHINYISSHNSLELTLRLHSSRFTFTDVERSVCLSCFFLFCFISGNAMCTVITIVWLRRTFSVKKLRKQDVSEMIFFSVGFDFLCRNMCQFEMKRGTCLSRHSCGCRAAVGSRSRRCRCPSARRTSDCSRGSCSALHGTLEQAQVVCP